MLADGGVNSRSGRVRIRHRVATIKPLGSVLAEVLLPRASQQDRREPVSPRRDIRCLIRQKRYSADEYNISLYRVLLSTRVSIGIRYTMREVEEYDAGNCEVVQRR